MFYCSGHDVWWFQLSCVGCDRIPCVTLCHTHGLFHMQRLILFGPWTISAFVEFISLSILLSKQTAHDHRGRIFNPHTFLTQTSVGQFFCPVVSIMFWYLAVWQSFHQPSFAIVSSVAMRVAQANIEQLKNSDKPLHSCFRDCCKKSEALC